MHRDRRDDRSFAHDKSAVHLRIGHCVPATREQHLSGKVRRGVEVRRKDTVRDRCFDTRLAMLNGVHAVVLQIDEKAPQCLLVFGGDAESRPTGVEVRPTELDLDELVIRAGCNDNVKHLRER